LVNGTIVRNQSPIRFKAGVKGMGVRPTQLTALPFKIFYNHAFQKENEGKYNGW